MRHGEKGMLYSAKGMTAGFNDNNMPCYDSIRRQRLRLPHPVQRSHTFPLLLGYNQQRFRLCIRVISLPAKFSGRPTHTWYYTIKTDTKPTDNVALVSGEWILYSYTGLPCSANL